MKISKKYKIVLIGGGVGSSTFTRALKDLGPYLATITSAFDDGGSTGALRRDYPGPALADFRQSLLASLELDNPVLEALNYRFGKGFLYGVNTSNILLAAFWKQFKNPAQALDFLHKFLGLKNTVTPISFDYARLQAKTSNGKILADQHAIQSYYSFQGAPVCEMFLDRKVAITQKAKQALLNSHSVAFAPGNFFSSLLPNILVPGFAEAWQKSAAYKIWFVNLLAHRGQDSFYNLADYLNWFEKYLGPKPFDCLVVNKSIPKSIITAVADQYQPLKVTSEDIQILKKKKVDLITADLLYPVLRSQTLNDTVSRAPLRHDPDKIKEFVNRLFAKLEINETDNFN